mmetsp:Transcript_24248/g.21351  ORF Transcript_24248/g.21351 Transcript_24248/m.21351 type:complete len:241 (+) Transcript_24248:48-770(+)
MTEEQKSSSTPQHTFDIESPTSPQRGHSMPSNSPIITKIKYFFYTIVIIFSIVLAITAKVSSGIYMETYFNRPIGHVKPFNLDVNNTYNNSIDIYCNITLPQRFTHNYKKPNQTDSPWYSYYTTKERTPSDPLLCKLGLENRCRHYQVAEVLDSLWVIGPMYSFYQDYQLMLYKKMEDFSGYIQTVGAHFQVIEARNKEEEEFFRGTLANNEPSDVRFEVTDYFHRTENLINVGVKRLRE